VFQAVVCTVCRSVCDTQSARHTVHTLTFYMCNKEVHLLVIRT